MTSYSSALAQAAVESALAAQASTSPDRAVYNSRTAEKFIIRSSADLFKALRDLALEHGRSINAELNAAIMEALGGHARTGTLLAALHAHLGQTTADQLLATVPDFAVPTDACSKKFVLRLPENVRTKVGEISASGTMNRWLTAQLITWINYHRQEAALLSACIDRQAQSATDVN